MNSTFEWVLPNLVIYGAPLLLLLTYIGSLGIPFPVTLVVMAAGALAHEGILDWWVAVLACMAGAALADHSLFALGYWINPRLERRFAHNLVWQQALTAIQRQGGWAILLTRFWLTSLAPAVNLIAGSRYPYRRFLLLDLTGELLWVLAYGGLGYLFARQWQTLSHAVSGFSALSGALALLAAAIYLIARRKKAAR